MARISRESIERVRESADMAEVVSQRSELRRAGSQLVGLCPFHEERTPSFSVDPAKKVYHCFGCGAQGSIFDYVMETEALGFPEAVESLADRYGVELEREGEDPQAEAERKRAARMVEVLERTAHFYQEVLWRSEEAAPAREHLLGRGLEEQALRDFGVGFAPSRWDSVLVRGQKAGFSVDELLAAGLVKPSRRGGTPYDHFRGRIMFPIRDQRGRTLGFGARILSGEGPKYVNSPEGSLFGKRRLVYGLDRARAAIARSGRAVLVEGYTDVIALHGAGIAEAVATMGTAVTDDQLARISAHAGELVLALDADSAGQEAMVRAHAVAHRKGMRVRVVVMPGGEDPCDVVLAHGADRFRELLEGAVDFAEFRVDRILADSDLSTPVGRDDALSRLAPVLGPLEGPALRGELERRAADRLDLDPSLVREAVARAGRGAPRPQRGAEPGRGPGQPGPPSQAPESPSRRALTPRERRERTFLAMCIAAPELGTTYVSELSDEDLSGDAIRQARQWIAERLQDPLEGLPDEGDWAREVRGLVAQAGHMRRAKGGAAPYEERQRQAPPTAQAIEWLLAELDAERIDRALAAARRESNHELVATLVVERDRARSRVRQAEVANTAVGGT